MFSEQICYFDSHHPDAASMLADYLSGKFREFPAPYAAPVFLCIGSEKVSGDSLGPMVGSSLKKIYKKDIPVYGTLEMPVHALNLKAVLHDIRKYQRAQPLVAIDASLGRRDHLGFITAGCGGIAPGAGVNKSMEVVGDLFITGIVAASTPFSHLILQTTQLSEVMLLANQITTGISLALKRSLVAQTP